MANEIHKMNYDILEQLSKPQHKKVSHDLTTNTWWLAGIVIVLFFLVFFLTVQIYDQSKEIDRLELSDSFLSILFYEHTLKDSCYFFEMCV